MNVRWEISQSEMGKFVTTCEAVIRNVDRGTKAATEFACAEILSNSIAQVPIDTGALASTGDYIVRRRNDVKGYSYEGIVGYAGSLVSGHLGQGVKGTIGATLHSNAVNPKSGKRVSSYAARVHEDLDMPHPNGGKAKFLEDPVRDYSNKFKRVAESYWRIAIYTTRGRDYNMFGKLVDTKVNVYRRVKLTPGQAAPGGRKGTTHIL